MADKEMVDEVVYAVDNLIDRKAEIEKRTVAYWKDDADEKKALGEALEKLVDGSRLVLEHKDAKMLVTAFSGLVRGIVSSVTTGSPVAIDSLTDNAVDALMKVFGEKN